MTRSLSSYLSQRIGKGDTPAAAALMTAAAVCALGFGALNIFWWFGGRSSGLAGLYDYRSATVGDGLLLPALAALLVLVSRALPRTHLDRWALGVGLLGAVAGALLQAAWLRDDNPNRNWTLPRPHHFTIAGWWHGIFLTAMSALVLGLASLAAIRLRQAIRAGEVAATKAAAHPLLFLFFALASTFAGFAALDNATSSATTAGIGTTVGLAASAGVALLFIAIAFSRDLVKARRAAVGGLAMGAGATALAAHGLEVSWWLGITAAVTAVLLAGALVTPEETCDPLSWAEATANALVLLGGFGLAVHVVNITAGRSGLILLGTAGIVLTVAGRERYAGVDSALAAGALVFPQAVLVLSAWLEARRESVTEASAAIGGATVGLDLLVFALIRERFRSFTSAEEARRRGSLLDQAQAPSAAQFWSQAVGFGVSAIVALLLLFKVSAKTLGLDRDAGAWSKNLVWLAAIVGVASVVAVIGAVVAGCRQPPRADREGQSLAPSWFATTLSSIAAAGLAAGFAAFSRTPPRYTSEIIVGTIGIAALVLEDLLSTPGYLQLAKPGLRGIVISATATAAAASSLYWLLSTGLWDGEKPAAAGGVVVAALLALLSWLVVVTLSGVTASLGLRSHPVTAEEPAFNALLGQAMYAFLALMTLCVPLFAVIHVDAATGLRNAGLIVFGSLGFAPAFLAAFFWVLANNRRHASHEAEVPIPKTIWVMADGDADAARSLNRRRVGALQRHALWQNGMARLILALAIIWATERLT